MVNIFNKNQIELYHKSYLRLMNTLLMPMAKIATVFPAAFQLTYNIIRCISLASLWYKGKEYKMCSEKRFNLIKTTYLRELFNLSGKFYKL